MNDILTVDKLTPDGKRVYDILLEFEDARSNYNILLWRYWAKYNKICDMGDIDFKKIKRLPSCELITRLCRKIQHDLGKLPPSDKVKVARQSSISDFAGLQVVNA